MFGLGKKAPATNAYFFEGIAERGHESRKDTYFLQAYATANDRGLWDIVEDQPNAEWMGGVPGFAQHRNIQEINLKLDEALKKLEKIENGYNQRTTGNSNFLCVEPAKMHYSSAKLAPCGIGAERPSLKIG